MKHMLDLLKIIQLDIVLRKLYWCGNFLKKYCWCALTKLFWCRLKIKIEVLIVTFESYIKLKYYGKNIIISVKKYFLLRSS